jgi:protein required for attachment to host cells
VAAGAEVGFRGFLGRIRQVALVVAADSARARLFRASSPTGPLRELETLTNAEARLHERDLVSGPAGRSRGNTMQAGFSAFGGGSMKRHRVEEFAAEVCGRIAAVLRKAGAPRLYIIAEPEFLGLLRLRLDDPTKRRIAGELPKSLASKSPEEIRKALPRRL